MRQYLMTVHDDGSIKLTERALTKRDSSGRFAPNKKRVEFVGKRRG